ncbi:MAG TPA: ATP-dependent DNA helicase RecQ [Ginsengibacter sp.]
MENAVEILKKYWGYDAFRPLQDEIISSILAGNDTLALMPTGGGKSICFQVPAMMKDGLCLVISPLIALMKDQVANLKQKGIPALSIYSGMSYVEVIKTLKNAAYGNFKFLYVSPERLETELFLEYFSAMNVNLLAVDEAHCVSQWGYDFRPPYLRIANIRKSLQNVPVLALTASATLEVQNDICDKLTFKNKYKRFQQSFERSNLSYSVFNPSSKQNKLLEILKKVNGSGIVYCKSRKRTKEIEELLNLNGIRASHYHAGLSNEVRNTRQEEWINDKTRVMACTNAFGMGIDKPDVRTVIHYDVPDALENYYQEAGRAGRDGKKSYAVLFFNEQEIRDLKKQSSVRFPDLATIKSVYASLVNYFQLPTGSGEDLSFDFDISDFVKKFKLDAPTVNNILKILEQEELIGYSDQFFVPAMVAFTCDKAEMDLFEKTYPKHDPVIKGLLRSYEGIFDYPSAINETRLTTFISMKKEQLVADLIEIKKMGIIEYTPQKEKPQIKFLQNRVSTTDLVINQKNILKRKDAFEKRLCAMLDYVKDEHTCRSKMIAAYFNDTGVKRCGVCDNCLREKNITITKEEFEKIREGIKNLISSQPVNPKQLIREMPYFKQNKILKILHFLQEENIVVATEDGLVKMKTG